jgi:hypothetical protein
MVMTVGADEKVEPRIIKPIAPSAKTGWSTTA